MVGRWETASEVESEMSADKLDPKSADVVRLTVTERAGETSRRETAEN